MTQFDAQQVNIVKQLDTRGLRCPEPVMMLHQAVRRAQSGEVIEIFATDPSTSWDIPKFCMHLGHTLLVNEQRDAEGKTEYYYQVQKK